jgi:hypothetical protein
MLIDPTTLTILLASAVIFGIAGAAILTNKGHSGLAGFALCASMPLVGLIVCLCIPRKRRSATFGGRNYRPTRAARKTFRKQPHRSRRRRI